MNAPAHELRNEAKEAAWNGRHAHAITLCTHALTQADLPVPIQLQLLDTRAESHIAQGQFEHAAADAQTMRDIAQRENDPAYTAQALNRTALVQMRQGKLQEALDTATAALAAAQMNQKDPLLAESYFRLSEAQSRARERALSLANAEKALAIYEQLGDRSGQGRALWSVANSYVYMGRAEETRQAARRAITLCQQAGDLYGLGNALNTSTWIEEDLAQNIVVGKKAIRAFEQAGYLERQAVMKANLANTYSTLGLQHRVRRLNKEVLEISKKIGAQLLLANTYLNLADVELTLQEPDLARDSTDHIAELLPTVNDSLLAGYHLFYLGKLALLEGKAIEALPYFEQAVAKVQSTSTTAIFFEAYLGMAYLANGDAAAALNTTSRALEQHRTLQFARVDDLHPEDVWWYHARALAANGQTAEAYAAIEEAYGHLLAAVVNVRDIGLRRSFLNKVKDHRELLEAWVKEGQARAIDPDKLLAHLQAATDPREPFQRLNDTGLRLNELRTAEALHTFLVEEATELSGGERVLLILEEDGQRRVAHSLLPHVETADTLLTSHAARLDHVRRTRTVQLETPADPTDLQAVSRIIAPLIAQNSLLGYLYVDMAALYGVFDETDRDMMGMLANQTAVALDNARWAHGLEQKVEERTEQLNQRVDELAILNSVGDAMAKTLDVKTVTKIVGDKVRDIFKAEVLAISLLEEQTSLIHTHYQYDQGEGGYVDFIGPFPLGKGLTSKVIKTRKPLLLGTLEEQQANGVYFPPGILEGSSGEIAQSQMVVPIIVNDKPIGVVSVANYKQNYFSENNLSLLQTLAANMGIAIQNARFFEAEQERVAELQIINSIQQGLAAELDFQAIIDLVGDKLRQTFNTGNIGIAWYDARTNLLQTLYSYEHGQRTVLEPPGTPGSRSWLQIAKTRQPLILNSVAEQKAFGITTVPGTDQQLSMIRTPIVAGDQLLGLIDIFNHERENAYGESDIRLLQTVTSAMGVALENARLFNETQRLLKETEERNAELAVINSIQQGLAAELDFQAIVDLVGDKLREVFGTPDLAINWYDENNNLIQPLYYYEHGTRHTIKPYPPTAGGLFETMRKTRKPIVYNTPEEYKEINVIPGTDLSKSLVTVPIISSNHVLGSLQLENYERQNAFGESELRLLTTMAAALGTALENARLFDETQRRAREMAALTEVGRDISATLDLTTVLERIAKHARELLEASDSALFIPDATGQVMRATVALGPIAAEVKATTVNIGQGILGDIWLQREAELLNEPNRDPRAVTIAGTQENEDERMMVSPLLVGDEVVGLLVVWRTGDTFEEENLHFLDGLGRQAAIAIQNARLFSEAEAAQALAVEANQAKSAFLATMSHELRTPLNAIIGFTRIVKRKGQNLLPEKQTENLGKVLSSAEHLLGLINTILDIAKIEAGRMDVTPSTFDAAKLVEVCVFTSQTLLNPGVEMVTELVDGLTAVTSDQDKIKQIILNLLSNAAKFTHNGTITIRTRPRDDFLVVDVMDTGIGIPTDKLEAIFEEFQQADSSTTREYGGTGLGLSISRHLARLLGGELSASSAVGQGSTFTLMVPLQYGSLPQMHSEATAQTPVSHLPSPPTDREAPLIVAIDDNPDVVAILRENLADAGYEVVGAMTAAEGLAKVKELRPSAITLDIILPDRDGWQVLHDLKVDPATREIPVIMLTIVDNKAMGFQLGAADYLVKPLDSAALLAALARMVPIGDRPAQLLVVDDDPNVHEMVGQLLEERPYALSRAEDGLDALEQIQHNRPDAILLDLMMPRLDGFGLLAQLRQDPATMGIPVIVLTAKSLTAGETAVLQASAQQIVQKQGLRGDDLLAHLQKLLPIPSAANQGAGE